MLRASECFEYVSYASGGLRDYPLSTSEVEGEREVASKSVWSNVHVRYRKSLYEADIGGVSVGFREFQKFYKGYIKFSEKF